MFIIDGKKIDINNPYRAPDGTNYPNLRNPEDRAKVGVVEHPDPVYPDPEYYFITEAPDGAVTSTPRDFATVQAARVAKVNAAAGAMLQPTDWQVIRKAERGVAIVPAVEAYRAAVVAASNQAVSDILAATTLDQLQAVAAPAWPSPL